MSTEFPVAKGLQQKCSLPPTLFKIYLDKVLEKFWRKCNPMGISITEETFLYTLHFASYQVETAHDKDNAEYLWKDLKEEYKKCA